MNEKRILKKNPDVVTRMIDKETILVPILKRSDEINCIYTLNKAASIVWGMIDGKKTVKEIKKAVLRKFDINPEKATEKLQELLKDLKKIKAVL